MSKPGRRKRNAKKAQEVTPATKVKPVRRREWGKWRSAFQWLEHLFAVLGMLSTILFFRPLLKADPGEPADLEDPFGAPIKVTNEGPFPIYDVFAKCVPLPVGQIQVVTGTELPDSNPGRPTVRRGEQFTVNCDRMLAVRSDMPVAMRLVVNYTTYTWLPLHQYQDFVFVSMGAKSGKREWRYFPAEQWEDVTRQSDSKPRGAVSMQP